MRLRTQIVLLVIALFSFAGIVYEQLNKIYLEPEFERHGLETISLLAGRERSQLEHTLELAEAQAQAVLSAPTSSQNQDGLVFESVITYREVTGGWMLANPEAADGPAQPPAWIAESKADQWTRLVRSATGKFELWIRQGAKLARLVLNDEDVNLFSEITAPAHGYLVTKDDSGSADPAADFWKAHATASAGAEKVQITESPEHERVFVASFPSERYQFQVVIVWPETFVKGQWLFVRDRARSLAGLGLALLGFFAMFMVRRSLKPLEELEAATQSMSEGDFKVRFARKRSDEVGHLMASFETMSGRIDTLMQESVSAARMEVELRAAQMVQGMYLPSRDITFGSVRISGKSHAANECGGDLWSAWETHDNVYVIVADATGHGVSAALLTAALKSAISIFEARQTDDLDDMIKLLRRAISGVGHGQINMTGMLFQIGKSSGMVNSFNASHLEAYRLPATIEEDFKWNDVKIIFEPVNPTLGSSDEGRLVKMEILDSGDRIVTYTDGIFDIPDAKGERWKERNFLKMLLERARGAAEGGVSALFQSVWEAIEERMADRVVPDDVSLVMIEWQRPDRPN